MSKCKLPAVSTVKFQDKQTNSSQSLINDELNQNPYDFISNNNKVSNFSCIFKLTVFLFNMANQSFFIEYQT